MHFRQLPDFWVKLYYTDCVRLSTRNDGIQRCISISLKTGVVMLVLSYWTCSTNFYPLGFYPLGVYPLGVYPLGVYPLGFYPLILCPIYTHLEYSVKSRISNILFAIFRHCSFIWFSIDRQTKTRISGVCVLTSVLFFQQFARRGGAADIFFLLGNSSQFQKGSLSLSLATSWRALNTFSLAGFLLDWLQF